MDDADSHSGTAPSPSHRDRRNHQLDAMIVGRHLTGLLLSEDGCHRIRVNEIADLFPFQIPQFCLQSAASKPALRRRNAGLRLLSATTWRRPRSTSARSVVRSRAASLRASRKRESRISTVIFIAEVSTDTMNVTDGTISRSSPRDRAICTEWSVERPRVDDAGAIQHKGRNHHPRRHGGPRELCSRAVKHEGTRDAAAASSGHAGHIGRLGLARGCGRQCRPPGAHAQLRPPVGHCPRAFLHTSGKDVGLPPGQMGNSEVGHLNIGAGRVVMQDLPRITDAIADGAIEQAPTLRGLIERLRRPAAPATSSASFRRAACIRTRTTPSALAKILAERRRADASCMPSRTAATRRRDRRARTSRACLRRCPPRFRSRRSAAATTRWIATSAGSASSKAYQAIVEADGPRFPDAGAAVADAYAHDISDEFVLPAVIGDYARHARRRRRAVLQLSRRPRARDSRRDARSGVFRFPARARVRIRARPA